MLKLDPPIGQTSMQLLTFDVEHWYEGYRYRGVGGWENVPARDDRMVGELLDLLAETKQRATLFFTGRYAEEFPYIVRRAANEGHEVASHSHSHIVLSKMGTLAAFRDDLVRSITLLEDLTGIKVKGYRAPKWTIFDLDYREVLGVMHEAGLIYDSSVFPAILDGARARGPRRVELGGGDSIWEVPATTYPLMGFNLPVAGGLYFRLLPLWVTMAVLNASQLAGGQPGMIYLHPYDLDMDCPRLPGGNPLFRWMRYYKVADSLSMLTDLLATYQFGPVCEWVESQDGM